MNSRSKIVRDLRSLADKDVSSPGAITDYLIRLGQENPRGEEGLRRDLVETFSTESGARVLILLTKSLVDRAQPLDASDRALLADNALRNLAMEIRRLVANG